MCGSELLALPESVQKVATYLLERGHPHAPVMLDDAARTAQQAADGLGVALGQIAKSIVFRRKSDDAAVLVVISGDQRVNEKKVEAAVCPDGKRMSRADAAFVKAITGFSIGGVSPVGHAGQVVVLMDASLFRFTEVWAAAGHPNAVFKLTPQALQQLTDAPVSDWAVQALEEKQELQNAIKLVALQAIKTPAPGQINSPCIAICRISEATGLCEGCFRTRAELTAWGNADNATKRAVWGLIEQRMAALQAA